MEHNMVASSRIYDNVRFEELGMLLQIPAQQVPCRRKESAPFASGGRFVTVK